MKAFICTSLVLLSFFAMAQDIVPRERFGELQLGTTYEDVIWVLGFDGTKVTRESAPEMLTAPVTELGVDFDYIVNFRYIMDLPVTSVYFKDNLVVYFTISSYPEYNQFICQDLETNLGVKFWDSKDLVEASYGNKNKTLTYTSGNLVYLAYQSEGISFGMDNEEVRTISIFNPDFK